MDIAAIVLEFEGDTSFLDAEGERAGLIVLAALLVSFLLIRASTRLMRSPRVPWWPGSIQTEGGLHVHHLVFGIVLMLLGGFLLALRLESPWMELAAAGFGIGAGLTLDEYALWLHLEDVYWAEEGRQSVDAVIVSALVGGLVLMGFLPFSTDSGAPTIVLSVLVSLAVAAIAVLKGKVFLGVAGMLFLPAGLIGAIRLAKPDSPWARRRYPEGSRKRDRVGAPLRAPHPPLSALPGPRGRRARLGRAALRAGQRRPVRDAIPSTTTSTISSRKPPSTGSPVRSSRRWIGPSTASITRLGSSPGRTSPRSIARSTMTRSSARRSAQKRPFASANLLSRGDSAATARAIAATSGVAAFAAAVRASSSRSSRSEPVSGTEMCSPARSSIASSTSSSRVPQRR